jgi:L-rhamnose isomerase
VFGPVTLLHLIVFSAISAAFGAVVLYYDWTMNLTASVPDVRFYNWNDSTQSNTINLPYNLYADIWTVDDNATYGIKNNAVSEKIVHFWVESCSDPTRIANYTVQILNGTSSVLCTWTTTDFSNAGESNAVSWTADANSIDTIKVMIKGASAVANVTIELRLKTSE